MAFNGLGGCGFVSLRGILQSHGMISTSRADMVSLRKWLLYRPLTAQQFRRTRHSFIFSSHDFTRPRLRLLEANVRLADIQRLGWADHGQSSGRKFLSCWCFWQRECGNHDVRFSHFMGIGDVDVDATYGINVETRI